MDNRLKVLDQIKLVPEENKMSTVAAYVYLQDVIEEGIRSTFGMRHKDSILLRVADDLRTALQLADKSEEQFKQLKALQLENGRLKKRLSVTEEQLDKFQTALAEKTAEKLREQDKEKDTEDRPDTGPTA